MNDNAGFILRAAGSLAALLLLLCIQRGADTATPAAATTVATSLGASLQR